LEKYIINGGKPLRGEVTISGAKNAVVGIIPAALLVDGICRIENVPRISDVEKILAILHSMGVGIRTINRNTIEIDARHVQTTSPPSELVRKMRGSYYLLGALLGRFGRAKVAMPGGCYLGARPIDQHEKGFRALGADLTIDYGMIDVSAPKLTGASVYLDIVSVGATINVMLAAVGAEGVTVIENAAKEPHIVDVANFLNAMGAEIKGAGTDVIKVNGGRPLHGGTYSIIPDQIEAGTYMVAAAATKGEVLIKNVIPKHLDCITAKLEEMGVEVIEDGDAVLVRRTGPLKKANIKTLPYPGFPTDMQSQMAVLLSLAEGTSIITESVWDNRFKYVEELKKMGANIQVDGKVAVFEGVETLHAAPIKACDLRAGAAMVIAGLVAEGTTQVEEIYHIERGYEDIVEKLRQLGADIRYENIPDAPVLEKAN
jgi:UDP-N-acetylglucosamine 1-carboxyvinyltransferase